MVATATKTTAFIYIRVSTPSQEVDEQVRIIRQYAADNNIEIVGQYGDYQKRHKSHQRHSFQSMLNDIEAHKPNLILVQRLDRFGTADSVELGYFLTILKRGGVRLITAIDGKDRSKGDLETVIVNTVGAIHPFRASQTLARCALVAGVSSVTVHFPAEHAEF